MVQYFKNLVDGYRQANNETVKNILYDAMVKYTNEYHPGYECYDMGMYVALYKYAATPEQRKEALGKADSIVIDDSYQSHDEIISNFREFISLKDFIHEEDIVQFDDICKKALNFFDKELVWVRDQAKCGHADFGPDVSIPNAERELKEIAGLIVFTGMSNLNSYQEASQVLKWILAVSLSYGFFRKH